MEQQSTMLAAIDAGSNGIKMLLGEVDEHGTLWELEDVREAVRLGHDAFTDGTLSEPTLRAAVAAFSRFKGVLEGQNVSRVRAVGTSACRSVRNIDDLIRRARKATGIELEVIDGLEEARLVFQAIARRIYLRDKHAVLIDMGGGSVEVTLTRGGRVVGCESLEIGPVRLLERLGREGLDEQEAPRLLSRYEGFVARMIETELEGAAPQVWIGTGGNIQALGELRARLCDKGNPAKLKPADLDVIIGRLADMSVERRMKRLGLKADRADIIVIAAVVLRMLMREAGATRLLIPRVGLRHGLLHQLAQELKPHQWVRPATQG
jgi:exopolyphosphatase / guanosine-5'-triphosphate,3'-diphosphate pyrophosphatase